MAARQPGTGLLVAQVAGEAQRHAMGIGASMQKLVGIVIGAHGKHGYLLEVPMFVMGLKSADVVCSQIRTEWDVRVTWK